MSHEIKKPTDITIPSTSLWAKVPMLGLVMAVVGLGATFLAAGGEHKARALFSYLWAFEVLLSIALGALGFVLIEHITRAGWSVGVRRVAETAMATLPLFALLWLPIGVWGLHELFPWSHESDSILEKKRWYLSDGFFYGRAAIIFVVWVVLSQLLYRWSVRQDALVGGGEARDSLSRKLRMLSAPGIILFALSLTVHSLDWVMSLQPHWYSTMFGVYYFAGSMLAFFAFTILVLMGLQKAGVLRTAVTEEHFHDLGKYLFGFTVFWAYIAFSQFMLIWYANIPEETEFFMLRVVGGWEYISYALPVVHFFVPFMLLLSRHVKRNRTVLGLAAVWILVVHVIDLYWIILPNAGAHGGAGHHVPHLTPGWTDLMALVGMIGVFLAVFSYLLGRNKVLPVGDPRLSESLAFENY